MSATPSAKLESVKLAPVQLAAAVYQREPCARTFKEDLEAHLLHGWVVSTPTAFAMGRIVDCKAELADLVNPWVTFELGDTWLIYLTAGNLREALGLLPFDLPYIAWEKRNVLRIYPLLAIKEKLANRVFTL